MADIVIRGVTYSGIDTVTFSKSGGGTEQFIQPSGTISITENGTVDVTDYATAVVNVSGGGADPLIVLAVAGRHAADSLGGVYTGYNVCEPAYFSKVEGVDSAYTCLKAGTYDVDYFYKPGYNTSGRLVNVQLVIQINGTNAVNVTSTAATGGNGTASITLAAGDTLALKMRNTTSGSSLSHAGGMVLTTGA